MPKRYLVPAVLGPRGSLCRPGIGKLLSRAFMLQLHSGGACQTTSGLLAVMSSLDR